MLRFHILAISLEVNMSEVILSTCSSPEHEVLVGTSCDILLEGTAAQD